MWKLVVRTWHYLNNKMCGSPLQQQQQQHNHVLEKRPLLSSIGWLNFIANHLQQQHLRQKCTCFGSKRVEYVNNQALQISM
jgi:hypothetical protein